MRIIPFACVLSLSAFALAADTPDDGKERAALAGLWKGFAVEGKGEKPDQGPVKLELTITGKTIRGIELKSGERLDHGEGEYVLALTGDPKQLDASRTNERGRRDAWVGIYKLEGDTLYWCVAKKNRPTTFETVKGQFLLVLKRDKAAK